MRQYALYLSLLASVSALPLNSSRAVAAERAPQVLVSAGEFERQDTIVVLPLPDGWRSYNALQSRGGPIIPLQPASDGQAIFVLPGLKRGGLETYSLRISDLSKATNGTVTAQQRGGDWLLALSQRGEVLAYRAEKAPPPQADIKPIFARAGYLHPVRSPSGLVVTDDYPANHLHHHGLWLTWAQTEFEGRKPNFWEMGAGTGTVEASGVSDPVNGPVYGGLMAHHRFVDLSAPQPRTALEETWEVRVYNVGAGKRPYFLFDLVATETCASASPLKLLQYRYGGLGLRGHGQWNGKTNALFLTSEGETDRDKGNTTRARWCYLGGKVDGRQTGLVVLGHPTNLRAPQPLRLHPDEPFVCFAPSQLGDFEIKPNQPYVCRYRIAVFDGPPDPPELDRLWNDYAHPPEARLLMP